MTALGVLAAPEPDAVLATAIEVARAAAQQEAWPEPIGDHLGCLAGPDPDDGPVAVHRFAATSAAYPGWCWSVAIARTSDSDHVTVDEVVLEPADGALLAPAWVPWRERVRPGDLGVGDRLPAEPDDARLVPGYTASGDRTVDDLARELGLGRRRVMSRAGRLDAAERWHEGDTGPSAPMAKDAPAPCGSCGFYLPLEGVLRVALGVCGNEYSPTDGRVVAVDYGCGAHSEAVPETAPEPLRPSYDTDTYDFLETTSATGRRMLVRELTESAATGVDAAGTLDTPDVPAGTLGTPDGPAGTLDALAGPAETLDASDFAPEPSGDAGATRTDEAAGNTDDPA